MKIMISLLGSALFMAGVGGCATQSATHAVLHTETNSSGGVKILSLRWQSDKGGLLVYGTVERKVGYYGTRFRHLDLTVLGPDGNILVQQAANFSQNPIPYSRFHAGRISYFFKLASVPPPQSTIRVSVDCTELVACKQANNSH